MKKFKLMPLAVLAYPIAMLGIIVRFIVMAFRVGYTHFGDKK